MEFSSAVNEEGPLMQVATWVILKALMLSEKINLRRPHTVWFHLHTFIYIIFWQWDMWKGDQISGCQGRGMAGGGCQGVTMEGGTESFVVGGSCVFLLCSGCMNIHTWQQDPGAHRTLLSSVSALVSGLHCVRCHQEGKLGEGSLGPSLYCLCNLLLFHYCLILISLLSSK